ncbi:MAG TPA: hypothetical protein V6D06_14765 [Trichocoleus sp.]
MVYQLPPAVPAEVAPEAEIASNRDQFPGTTCPGANCPDNARPKASGDEDDLRGSGRIARARMDGFIDDIIAWQQPQERPAEDVVALLDQLSVLAVDLVIDARDGADYFDDDELARYGYCDMQISRFVRYPESAAYLKGSIKAAQQG